MNPERENTRSEELQQQLEALMRQREALQKERSRIARELHEVVQQRAKLRHLRGSYGDEGTLLDLES